MTISDEEYKENLRRATMNELRAICFSQFKVNKGLRWKIDSLWKMIGEKNKEIETLTKH